MEYLRYARPEIALNELELHQISKIIDSGWFCEGFNVDELEAYFIDTYNVDYAITCGNCTNGLIIALKAAGIKNTLVALPVFTWPSTLYAIECSCNTPVFVDIDPETWCIEKDNSIVRNVDCIISVDCFGVDSGQFDNKVVIYDTAHGFGIENLGNRGDVEVISFSFTKTVTGMQGGMILTNNSRIAREARKLSKLSSKMLEISAFMCLKSIEQYEHNLNRRRDIVRIYRDKIKVSYMEQKVQDNWNYSVYAILLESKEKADRVAAGFKNHNIEVKRYYEPLIEGFTIADSVYSRIIALPTHGLAFNRVHEICNIINEA